MPTRISEGTRAKCAAAWDDIMARISGGETVFDACAAHGLTRAMLWAYRADSEQLREAWKDALRDSADALFDEMLATARNSRLDSRHARVKCNALMWAAEKRDPDRYAPRSKHDLTVKTLDLSPILQRAEARLRAAAQHAVDAEIIQPALRVRTAADLL